MLVLGVVAIAFPAATALAATALLAWVLMLSGLTYLVLAFRAERYTIVLSNQIVGLAYALTGLAIFRQPLWGAAGITVVLSTVLIVQGALALMLYFTNESTSGWTLVDGILTVLVGAIVAGGWPFLSASALGAFVGLNLLTTGGTRLAQWMESERLKHRRAV